MSNECWQINFGVLVGFIMDMFHNWCGSWRVSSALAFWILWIMNLLERVPTVGARWCVCVYFSQKLSSFFFSCTLFMSCVLSSNFLLLMPWGLVLRFACISYIIFAYVKSLKRFGDNLKSCNLQRLCEAAYISKLCTWAPWSHIMYLSAPLCWFTVYWLRYHVSILNYGSTSTDLNASFSQKADKCSPLKTDHPVPPLWPCAISGGLGCGSIS